MTLIPQTDCEFTNALREYEAAHAVWMNTSVFSPAAERVKAAKDLARETYLAAYRRKYPTHIIN